MLRLLWLAIIRKNVVDADRKCRADGVSDPEDPLSAPLSFRARTQRGAKCPGRVKTRALHAQCQTPDAKRDGKRSKASLGVGCRRIEREAFCLVHAGDSERVLFGLLNLLKDERKDDKYKNER